MDIQTSLIYVGVLATCAAIVYISSILGIREKTYDEAIAEQRNMPKEELLIARSSRDKNKDKKLKKAAGKKVKEKPVEHEKSDQKMVVAESAPAHEKSHVEFEPEAEVLSDHPPQDEKKKKKKIKPILSHKNEQKVLVADRTLLANHFEESLPKDDLLLKRQASTEPPSVVLYGRESKLEDVLAKTGPVKANSKAERIIAPKNEKGNPAKNDTSSKVDKVSAPKVEKPSSQKVEKSLPAKAEKIAPQKGDKAAAKAEKIPAAKVEKIAAPKADKPTSARAEKTPVEEKAFIASAAEPVEAVNPAAVVAKEQRSRKKKNELATLQQMSGDREGVNVSLIEPLVKKAELSRTEIQNLIDLLLNKQGSAVANSEWIEGRQDPMVKLKKQLAEKEKALSDEQEAAQAVQSKLRELRVELNTDRSRWRQMEDTAAAKHLELQHMATRLQHAQEAHKVDKANLTQQLQQLQAKLAEDHVVMRKLQDDQSGVQQEFHGQRQQMELHIAHLTDQHQEVEGALKNQLNQLHAQRQEQENIIVSLRGECQNACENALAREADNKMYREQVAHLTSEVRRQESIAQDLNRQIEEIHHLKTKLDHRISTGARLESKLQYDCDALRQELTAIKEAYAKLQEEKDGLAAKAKAERDDLAGTINDLKAESRKADEKTQRLASELSALQEDSHQLKEENELLAAQVTERPAAEGRENGDLGYPEEKPVATKEDTSKLDSLLKEKEAKVEELSTQIINYKTEISKLNEDLEAQRKKNNDLRTRNWKAMDALSATEKSLETHLKESKKLVSESSSAIRLEEQHSSKQLLERLFPDVSVPACETHTAWVEQFVKSADIFLASLKSAPQPSDLSSKVAEQEKQIVQLTATAANYKSIISDTEALLKKLQDSAEEEEERWSQKVQQRDAELETLREDKERLEEVGRTQEMQSKLLELEAKLHSEEVEKHELTLQYSAMCAQLEGKGDSPDLVANVRQLTEEQVRLQEELATARDKEREMSKEVTKLRALVQIGQESLTQEHRLSMDLQHQVDKLNGVNEYHSPAATNGADAEASLPEGGSVKK